MGITTGMGKAKSITAVPPAIAATTPDSSHYTKGAPGTYTSWRGAAFQPRCREGRVGMIAAEVQGFLEYVP